MVSSVASMLTSESEHASSLASLAKQRVLVSPYALFSLCSTRREDFEHSWLLLQLKKIWDMHICLLGSIGYPPTRYSLLTGDVLAEAVVKFTADMVSWY